LPGIWQTLVLSQIALVTMALLALGLFPLVSRRFAGRFGQIGGRFMLVVIRSTPEYMLAYVLLQLLGPSMLPAIMRLASTTRGIVGYLMGRHADALDYRRDAPRGLDLYAYETVPRLYGQFLAYCLLPLGDHRARERNFRHPGNYDPRLLCRCGDLGAAVRRGDRPDRGNHIAVASIDLVSRTLRRALRISTLPTRLRTGRRRSHPHELLRDEGTSR